MTGSIQTTKNVKFLKCDVCSKHFKQEKSLIRHMDTQHNIECDFIRDQLKCIYCNKQYTKRTLLNKHMQCHGKDFFTHKLNLRIFQCKFFHYSSKIGNSGELCIKCSCCTKYFPTKFKMHEHARNEHEDRLKCKYCNKMFKQVDCKTAHIRKVHMKIATKQYTFVCSKCGKKFNSHMALSDHEQADCGTAPLYKCDRCDKSLHSLGSLKIHQLIHTGDLPFSCGFCQKRFVRFVSGFLFCQFRTLN